MPILRSAVLINSLKWDNLTALRKIMNVFVPAVQHIDLYIIEW